MFVTLQKSSYSPTGFLHAHNILSLVKITHLCCLLFLNCNATCLFQTPLNFNGYQFIIKQAICQVNF